MRKYTGLFLLLLATIVTVACCDGDQTPPSRHTDNKPAQIKAVHYFSSSWPKSFWEDFERSQVDEDFAQIKADGFNTIILVIPWMGFETGFDDGLPEPSVLYDRFEWLLAKIDEAGLDYGLRVGFPHNFDPENGISNVKLCTDIFIDAGLRENWVRYLGHISERVDQHRDSFKFAFFSWEDFFCPYASIPKMKEDQRLSIARHSGYQDWLAENYPKQLVELQYQQSFGAMESVPVPERGSPAYWFFLRFVDQFLINQLVTPGRQVIPELAMEVRVDKDLIHNGDKTIWAEHDLALADDRLRGSYWGAYNGARNEGELLTAKQALRNFESMLNEVSDNGKNTNHIVEQFNFVDNTPGYVGRHAQIDTDELPAFLEGAAELLKQKSRGYGLWAYRDYADSAIYNASFELGMRGWDTSGEVTVVENADGDQALHMQAGAVISQTFAPNNRFVSFGQARHITFCANFERPSKPAQISLVLNGSLLPETLDVNDTAKHCVTMDAETFKQREIVFSVSSDTEIQLDDLRLYWFVQTLGVYHVNGEPGHLRDLIVRMNTDWLSD